MQATIEQNVANLGLPAAVDPQISALNINSSPVVIASIAATSATGLDAVAKIANTEIIPQIQSLDGVAAADLTGTTVPQVTITLDPAKLADAGVSVQQITGVLTANNITVPAGQLQADGTRIPVSTIGVLTSIDQISNLIVGAKQPATAPGATPAPGQFPTPVKLSDVGTVELANVATTGYARTNGNPSLTLTITKTSDANTVQVAQAVEKVLNDAQAAHPGELTVTTVQNLSDFIVESQDGLLREGGLGALFAIITIFLFLFSLRSTLVAAISIPLSVLSALVLMQVAGITLNILTLGGLAVAVGRVVDDAIVVLENIYRHRAMGEDRLAAVTNGPREVARAITASTLTTILVFLPIGFVGGLVSQLFLPFALTVTFALAASLVCALTVVPVLAYLFIDRVKLNVDEDGEPKNSFWIRVYTPTIKVALRSRWTRWGVLATAAVLFVASLTLVGRLPTQFINTGSEKVLGVTLAPPAGASSQAVLAEATKAEAILMAQPAVQIVQTSVPGESDTGFRTILSALNGQPANSATMTLRLVDTADLDEQAVVLSDALQAIKDDGYDVSVAQTAGFTTNGLNVVVSGADAASVESATTTVMAAISGRSDLSNLKSDLVKATPEIQVTVDPAKAALVGSTAAQIAQQVRAVLSPTTATTVTLDGTGVTQVVVQTDPNGDHLCRRAQPTAGRHGAHRAPRTGRGGQAGRRPGQHHAHRRPACRADHGRDHERRHGQGLRRGQDPGRRSRRAGRDPRGRRRDPRGSYPAAERGLRRPVHLDGRGRPARLRDDGSRLQLAHHAVRHPVQPAAGDDRRLHRAVRSPAARSASASLIGFLMLIGIVVTNAIVLLDLVERLAQRGRSAQRRAHRGRPDPRSADPDDGLRDDPRAHPAGRGLQPGLDHRRRAGHGRHRRPVQLDAAHADRRAGRVLHDRVDEGIHSAPV